MNTPYQSATLRGAYRAVDEDGNQVYVALFDGRASDGRHTGYQARDVSWCVWVRDGRIVHAGRYAGRNRAQALREFTGLGSDPRLTRLHRSDPFGQPGTTWPRWLRQVRPTDRFASSG